MDFIAQVVNFLVLMALLTRILYRPVTQRLDQRHQEILRLHQEARDRLNEAAQQQARAGEELAKAGERARALVDRATQEAARLRGEELAQAKTEASQLLARARDEIDRKTAQAARELQESFVSVVMAATTQVVGREIRPADHQRLVEELASGLGQDGRGPA
ncbi:MAG: F0F1 ATP synthase subunit B [Bacillota bacterium]